MDEDYTVATYTTTHSMDLTVNSTEKRCFNKCFLLSDYQIKTIFGPLLLTCQPLSTFNRETLGELYKPLQDSLVTRCVEIMDLDKTKSTQSIVASTLKSIWSKVYPKPRRCWLPTGCLVRIS